MYTTNKASKPTRKYSALRGFGFFHCSFAFAPVQTPKVTISHQTSYSEVFDKILNTTIADHLLEWHTNTKSTTLMEVIRSKKGQPPFFLLTVRNLLSVLTLSTATKLCESNYVLYLTVYKMLEIFFETIRSWTYLEFDVWISILENIACWGIWLNVDETMKLFAKPRK